MATLTRDGVNIHFETYGSGPGLLLTHGYSATSEMWQGQIQALSENHTLILWDMRGHGQSDSPTDPAAYSEVQTTGDMAALLDHHDMDTAIIGGLSLGGYMSLAFYNDYAPRVRALLIIDTGPGYRKDAAREGWNRQANATADNIAQHGLDALTTGSAERAHAAHRDPNGLVMAGRHMLTQHSARVIESLPSIQVPAIVVVGADDEPFLIASDYMAAKIPGASKVVIPDAGHAVNIDQPEVFNRVIGDFLAEHAL